jgi:DNA-binding transcriptional regulator YiaG
MRDSDVAPERGPCVNHSPNREIIQDSEVALAKQVIRYDGCGFDGVGIEGGHAVHDTPYGEGVSVSAVGLLHKAIRETFLSRPGWVDGSVLRFVRTELGMAPEVFARRAGVPLAEVIAAEAAGDRVVERDVVLNAADLARSTLGDSIPAPGSAEARPETVVFSFAGGWNRK